MDLRRGQLACAILRLEGRKRRGRECECQTRRADEGRRRGPREHLGAPAAERAGRDPAAAPLGLVRELVAELEQVCEPNDILSLQEAVRGIYTDVLVQEYIVSLMNATRNHDSVYLGASPRGSLALQRLGQARAVLDGRDFVLPDDVKVLAYPALGHRIILNAQARVKGATVQQVLAEALQRLPVPGVRAAERASRRG